MVGIAYAGGNSVVALRKDVKRIEHWAIVIVLTGVAIYLLYKYIKAAGKRPTQANASF